MIAGQGTLGVEFVEDATPLDVMLVPVGGGGLMAGVVTAVKALSSATEVIGVQAERFSAFTRWIQAQRAGAAGDDAPLHHPSLGPYSVDTLAYGIAVKLTVSLPGLDADAKKKLVDAAHQVCPYSNATRGNIPVELTIA